MKLTVKRVFREYKPAGIYKVGIETTRGNKNFMTSHSPDMPIGEAVEEHLRMVEESK